MNPLYVLCGALFVAALAIIAIGILAHRGAVQAGAIDPHGDWAAIPPDMLNAAIDDARSRAYRPPVGAVEQGNGRAS